MDSHPALCEAITCAIAASPNARITFAEYMELVLYHPQHGYYVNKAVLGKRGDFFTSVHLGADFGELLAEQFVQMWEIMGKPPRFMLVEMGAGQGILAADILNYIEQHYSEFFQALAYVIVERSSALRAQQQQLLKGKRIEWRTLEEIPVDSITGCCFSNELVDAFPVHQFVIDNQQLREIYVTTPQPEFKSLDNFCEVIGEVSTPRLTAYFDLVEIKLPSPLYPDGYRSEVNLAALDWLSAIASRLQRGYLLTIDYGYLAERYYAPTRRRGTLQCYYRHQRHDNPYIHIGNQDITAHIDFTALQAWGEVCGFKNLGFTQQGLFLMALGAGDRLNALTTMPPQQVENLLLRRDALHQLIDPMGLGGFGVLIQSKGITPATPQLKGLILPA